MYILYLCIIVYNYTVLVNIYLFDKPIVSDMQQIYLIHQLRLCEKSVNLQHPSSLHAPALPQIRCRSQ